MDYVQENNILKDNNYISNERTMELDYYEFLNRHEELKDFLNFYIISRSHHYIKENNNWSSKLEIDKLIEKLFNTQFGINKLIQKLKNIIKDSN